MFMNPEILKVLHWNANGLCNDVSDRMALYSRVTELDVRIFAINEAHEEKLFFPEFNSIICSKDLSVFVFKDISFSILELFNSPYADIIVLKSMDTVFIFGYLRNGKSAEGISKFIEVLSSHYQSAQKIVAIGDLNAKMTLLGNRSANTAGNYLSNFLDAMDTFVLLNEPGVFTFQRNSPYNLTQVISSVLDLCLASQEMLGQVSDFQVLPSFGSDHFPLLLEISQSFLLNDEILTEYESFYELRSQNLHMIQKFPQTFKKDVDHFVSTMIPQPFTLDANELWSKLQGAIYQGLKKNHLLRPKCKKRKFNSMMLSDELLQLRQENRNVFRRKIQIMRKEKWHKFVSSIDADEDRSSIWRKFRISLGKKRSSQQHGDLSVEVEKIRLLFEKNSVPAFPRDNYDTVYLLSPQFHFSKKCVAGATMRRRSQSRRDKHLVTDRPSHPKPITH